MTRIIVLLLFSVMSLQAWFCSSSSQDGGPTTLTALNLTAITQLTSSITPIYTSIKIISASLKEESKTKAKYLQNIENLTKANTLKEQKISFEYERYKKLLDNYGNMQGSLK